MPTDLFGDSILLSLGFKSEDEGYVYGTIEAKLDPNLGAWVFGHSGIPAKTVSYPLQATDIVAFCHAALRESTKDEEVLWTQQLLSKTIVLRQALRLSRPETTMTTINPTY